MRGAIQAYVFSCSRANNGWQQEKTMDNTRTSDPLVTTGAVRRELGDVSSMTVWRWQKSGILPKPSKINGRKYWKKSEIEAVKVGMASTGEVA